MITNEDFENIRNITGEEREEYNKRLAEWNRAYNPDVELEKWRFHRIKQPTPDQP